MQNETNEPVQSPEQYNLLQDNGSQQAPPKKYQYVCHILSIIMCFIVAILHILFGLLESILWRSNLLNMPPLQLEHAAVMAANQGFYNWMLAAGLIVACLGQNALMQFFFVLCVICAAIVGALTATWTIILLQGIPAMIAMAFLIPKMRWLHVVGMGVAMLVALVFGLVMRFVALAK